MNKYLKDLEFRVYTTPIEKTGSSGERRLIRGYASVGDVLDRQNEIITLGALVKAREDLLENNTIFYEHKHSELPIGKTIAVDIDEKGLLITVEISKAPFVDSIWTLIQEGILNSFSIGGRVIESEEKRDKQGNLFNEITTIELFETSIVGLPANPAAKFELISKSFNRAITEEMKKREDSNKMAKETKKEVEKETKTKTEVETPVEKTEDKSKTTEKKEVELEKSEETPEEKTEEKEVEKSEEAKEEKSEEKKEEKSKETPKEDTVKLEKSEEAEEGKEKVSEKEVEKTEDKEEDKEEEVLQKDHSNNATTEDADHWHEATVDENGKGETTTIVTKEGYAGDANHKHEVVDGEVKESGGHTHDLIAPIETNLEDVSTEKSEEKEVTKENAEDTSLNEDGSEKSEDKEKLEEKSLDEQVLEALSKLIEMTSKKKEQDAEKSKEEIETPAKEKVECEACAKSEAKEEDKEEKKEEAKEDKLEKVVEPVSKEKSEEKVEKKEEDKEEKKVEKKEDPTRKGVIVVEQPYADDDEKNKLTAETLNKIKEAGWVKLMFQKKSN